MKIPPALTFYLSDRVIRYSYGLSTALAVGIFIAVALTRGTEDIAPLHYNVYFGIDFVGDPSLAYGLPISALFVVVLNAAVGLSVWRRERVPSYFLALGTLAFAVIMTTATMLNIQLIT